MPLPFDLSGVVTTSEGTSPSFRRSSRKTVASSGVPKNANLTCALRESVMSLFRLGFVVIHFCRLVRVENAFEVIHFVLKHMRKKA